jgi:iron-sulfur cluster repair protein YtfE (RIC family)
MKATEARITLLAQHDRLRGLLDTCTRLARLHRTGEAVASELDEALADLRDAFAEHNQSETAIIGELLRGASSWSTLLVDRMLEEHVGEHAAFWQLLSGSDAEVAQRIGELAEELDAHMAAEERTFLSPAALSDDVIRRRTRDLVAE